MLFRRCAILAIAVLCGGASPHQKEAAKSAASDPVSALFERIRLEERRHRADEFYDVPDHPEAAGTMFNVRGDLSPDGDDRTSFTWEYSAGQLTLRSKLISHSPPDQPDAPTLVIRSSRTQLRPYVAQNGFGARRVVSASSYYETGFAVTGGVTVEQTVDLQLSGDQAKAVAADTVAVVEGRLTPIGADRVAECWAWESPPEIDIPTDEIYERCAAGARVERIAFVRRSTGAVLAEWRPDKRPEATSAPGASDQTAALMVKHPTPADIVQYFPPRAMDLGREGSATISCIVTLSGDLSGCTIASETPAGMGFGAAAVGLSKMFHYRPATKYGAGVESKIEIPIGFRLAG